MLPNFFVVGAPKAGTTSLYYYLDQHPQIYMSPIKEPCFFAGELRAENFAPEQQRRVRRDMRALEEYLAGPMNEKRFGGLVADWPAYCSLFRGVASETAVGEASVCYLWSPTAAANIRQRIPEARIVMVLRDPADRAYSQHRHAVSLGLVKGTFRQHVEANLRDTTRKFGAAYPLLEFGAYSQQVARYTALFPRDRIRIYLYGEVDLRDLFQFLEVDPAFQPGMPERRLQVGIPRFPGVSGILKQTGLWPRLKRISPAPIRPFLQKIVTRPPGSKPMRAEDRAFLVDYYREDIRKLETLLDRDLSAWRDPVPRRSTAPRF